MIVLTMYKLRSADRVLEIAHKYAKHLHCCVEVEMDLPDGMHSVVIYDYREEDILHVGMDQSMYQVDAQHSAMVVQDINLIHG